MEDPRGPDDKGVANLPQALGLADGDLRHVPLPLELQRVQCACARVPDLENDPEASLAELLQCLQPRKPDIVSLADDL